MALMLPLSFRELAVWHLFYLATIIGRSIDYRKECDVNMRFARWVFLITGSSGVVTILALYFIQEKLGRDYPPEVNYPELYYGFVGVTLAWQFMFLLIAWDPKRFRLVMLPALMEKENYVGAILTRFSEG